VETVEFNASQLVVVIGQALLPDGSPLRRARLVNVEGYGVTDDMGWFQVEVAHDAPLLLRTPNGASCTITLPEQEAENGLVVYDNLVCDPA